MEHTLLTQTENELRFEELIEGIYDVVIPEPVIQKKRCAPNYAGLKYTAQWWETHRKDIQR